MRKHKMINCFWLVLFVVFSVNLNAQDLLNWNLNPSTSKLFSSTSAFIDEAKNRQLQEFDDLISSKLDQGHGEALICQKRSHKPSHALEGQEARLEFNGES